MSRRRKRPPADPIIVTIESLSHEGRGVTHVNGKTMFVDEGLPGEELKVRISRQHSRYSEAVILEILKPSPDRIAPECAHYAICGGCSFQHVRSEYQIHHKQRVLLEQLQHIGQVQPENVLPPLTGPVWGYRRRARLGVKHVEKKQKVLVGFREKNSPYIADINRCVVLHPAVGNIIEQLQQLITGLSIHRQLPQIEVAVADNLTALVFRHLVPLDEKDIAALKQFESAQQVVIYLQSGGIDTITPLSPERTAPLVYALSDFGITFEFLPSDFIQINQDINRVMVNQALKLLEAGQRHTVLDLFCGLGNFSLPLAKQAGQVTGVEGDAGLIARARENALRNGIANITFHTANLAQADLQAEFLNHDYDRVLLDPPRAGAIEIIQLMKFKNTERIVYVSCNPATLARDAGILVRDKGFHLQQAGVMDMFPHTSHVESIALFVR